MISTDIPVQETDHLISWSRTQDILVGYLNQLYFNMLFSGCYVCRKTFAIHRQYLASAQLLLTLEGEGKLRYQEKDYSLTPGTVMLINTWNLHEYQALNDGWKFKYLHFQGAMTDEYLSYISNRFGPVFPVRRKICLETEEHLDTIFRKTAGPSSPDYAALSAEIYAILTSFLSQDNVAESERKSAAAVRQAAAYIAENYRRNITTSEIAEAVYLSRSRMSELFTKTYGMAPHEYLTMYRLSHVKENLRESSASITEIAEQNGFRDVFALSRVFRQKYGMSPSEYRKLFSE